MGVESVVARLSRRVSELERALAEAPSPPPQGLLVPRSIRTPVEKEIQQISARISQLERDVVEAEDTLTELGEGMTQEGLRVLPGFRLRSQFGRELTAEDKASLEAADAQFEKISKTRHQISLLRNEMVELAQRREMCAPVTSDGKYVIY